MLFQFVVVVVELQWDVIVFGVFLQNVQIELYYVLVDQYVGVVFGKSGVEFFQQQGMVGDEDQFEVDVWWCFWFGVQYVDYLLVVVFQIDVVQFVVVVGFDIQ